jgi:GntR family transcriptional regulator
MPACAKCNQSSISALHSDVVGHPQLTRAKIATRGVLDHSVDDSFRTVTHVLARNPFQDYLLVIMGGVLEIRVSRKNEVPLWQQITAQIIFLIGTGELEIGDVLPSVRALARRLKIHHNTVSDAYTYLAHQGWLAEARGRRVVVRPSRVPHDRPPELEDIDDLIDLTIQLARKHGHPMQRLRERVRDRLLLEPSDHLLVIAPEMELGEVIRQELRQVSGKLCATRPIADLKRNVGMAIGATLLTPAYLASDVERLLPKARPVVPLTYSSAADHLAAIHNLSDPSTVGVVSVSEVFLQTARGLLAPAIGERHSFHEFLMQLPERPAATRGAFSGHNAKIERTPEIAVHRWDPADQKLRHKVHGSPHLTSETGRPADAPFNCASDLEAMDLLFCDSVAYNTVKHPRRVLYRLMSEPSLQQVALAAHELTQNTQGWQPT